jgi:hypothetical protein
MPRENLVAFSDDVRRDFLEQNVELTYGVIRFIEKDHESFLAWAREPCVCVLFHVHVLHTEAGKRKVREDLRRLIDRATQHGGLYYLTCHHWATRKQVEACYPQMVEFLRLKRNYDPQERFQSDWYRHYREMLADKLGGAEEGCLQGAVRVASAPGPHPSAPCVWARAARGIRPSFGFGKAGCQHPPRSCIAWGAFLRCLVQPDGVLGASSRQISRVVGDCISLAAQPGPGLFGRREPASGPSSAVPLPCSAARSKARRRAA